MLFGDRHARMVGKSGEEGRGTDEVGKKMRVVGRAGQALGFVIGREWQ